MAICSRSAKETSFFHDSTPSAVGPGSYDLAYGGKPFVNAAPPFLSSAMRRPFEISKVSTSRGISCHESRQKATPGPGDYKCADDASLNKTKARLGILHSRSSRFYVNKATSVESPGPGCYKARNHWLKKSFRSDRFEQSSIVPLFFEHSVPSIPAHEQCRGSGSLSKRQVRYVECSDGDIGLDPGHGSGQHEHRVLPGPGSYVPVADAFRKFSTMATFGKCQSKRNVFGTRDNPGPGQYAMKERALAASGTASHDVHEDSRMAIFKSGTLLAHQKTSKDHEDTPGPGAYLLDSIDHSEAPEKCLVGFGSQEKRGFQESTAPELTAVPGPGAYRCTSDFTSRSKSSRSSATKRAAFHQSSPRLLGYETLPPGPGTPLCTVPRHIAQGGFSSTQRRNTTHGPMTTVESPGPAGYSAAAATTFENLARQRGILSSMFRSRIERFKDKQGPTAPEASSRGDADGSDMRGDPKALGPGSYDVCRVWSNKRFLQSVPFLSSDARFGMTDWGENDSQPGPGSYRTLSFTQNINSERQRPYFTAERRFPERTPSFPGPGAYGSREDMVKRSFNVTFD